MAPRRQGVDALMQRARNLSCLGAGGSGESLLAARLEPTLCARVHGKRPAGSEPVRPTTDEEQKKTSVMATRPVYTDGGVNGENIQDNRGNIKVNRENIQVNGENIQVNGENIQVNREDIQVNQENIQVNQEAVKSASVSVTGPADKAGTVVGGALDDLDEPAEQEKKLETNG